MADWIRISLRTVSGVGRGMGVLDRVAIVEGEGAVFGVNFGRAIVTNGGHCGVCARATRSSKITLGGLVISLV